jgi:hypothetical protein
VPSHIDSRRVRASETHASAQARSSRRFGGRVRSAALGAALAALLAGPTVLAFASGGYFPEPRAWMGLVAWILVVIGLLACPSALPRGRAAWLTLGALALFAGWTLLSTTWAPIAGTAYHAGQLVFAYLGVLLAVTVVVRGLGAQQAVEPALAAGALVVICYGISERLLPGALHFARSFTSGGRLEQPLTYWNAMGELAAIALVLSARIAGDRTRPGWMRAVAAAGAAPLGMGLYLSFSRGALFAFAAGLVALIVLSPRREQLEAIAVVLVVAALSAIAAAPFRGVTSLAGSLGDRETQGAVALAALSVIAVAAAAAQWLLTVRGRSSALGLPGRAPLVTFAVICCGLALAIVIGSKESSAAPTLANGASRLTSLSSNRYAYWGVAMRGFESEPVRGLGAGGWAVEWLRYRKINTFAQDAHSLPLQTLAELGVVGLALLVAFFGGVGLVARSAHRTAPALAAGPIAGLVAYAVHSPLDWDWQMPAVTLLAMILAGMLLAVDGSTEARGAQHALSVPAAGRTDESERQRGVIGGERRAAEEPALDREPRR